MRVHWFFTILFFAIGIGIILFTRFAIQPVDALDRIWFRDGWMIGGVFLLMGGIYLLITPLQRRQTKRNKLLNEMMKEYEQRKRQP